MQTGAIYRGNGVCDFIVWAPLLNEMKVRIHTDRKGTVDLLKISGGYWHARVEDVKPGCRYAYITGTQAERPDPASFSQPEGVHLASEVIDHAGYDWKDTAWRGLDIGEMVMYELHVGTFTQEGTFKAILGSLNELADLGINTIQLMPVAQFPGSRNWGYDGVFPYAVQQSYGRPDDLKELVDACHRLGFAVLLDVVYNHLGPEGNYLSEFGPYFTPKYSTPWGNAINFDDEYSDGVKEYFIQNALYWLREFHIDGLRLDAIHAIYDLSAKHFLRCLADRVDEYSRTAKRKHVLIAESDLNDSRVIRPAEIGGYGVDAQWSDDFHHALHALLTAERFGYYEDFGDIRDIVSALSNGYVYADRYSKYRKRVHGNSSADRPARQFVIFSQNHDQVGNRMLGERLSSLVSLDALKLAAGVSVLSPYIPMLFMGEEYGETNPFLYFVSHSDQALIEAVRKGRREDFKSFRWQGEPPDPADEATFRKSKLQREEKRTGTHAGLYQFYKRLISLRKSHPVLRRVRKEETAVYAYEERRILVIRRDYQSAKTLIICSFSSEPTSVTLPDAPNPWKLLVDSAAPEWGGNETQTPVTVPPGASLAINPLTFLLFETG